MTSKYIKEPCKDCDGDGIYKFKNGETCTCSGCGGKGYNRRNIYPVTDAFDEADKDTYIYNDSVFDCPECQKDYYRDDLCEVTSGCFDNDLYECECGNLIDVCGEWDARYLIRSSTYENPHEVLNE